MLRLLLASIALVAGTAMAPAQDAASFPAQPVRLIIPFPAGGASDVIARAIGEELRDQWSQPLVIDNRPGAANMVGVTELLAAAPDGYTYLWGTSSLTSLNPFLFNSLPYDPETDLDPVSLVYTTREFVLVNAQLGVNSVEELVALARERPGEINYASFGNGSIGHLIGVALEQQAGIELNHVPYRGMAEILPDLLADRVQVVFTSAYSVVSQIESGEVKILALAAGERSPGRPDVPTLMELGYDIDMAAYLGVFAPAGTPLEIRERVAADFSAIVHDEAFRAQYSDRPDLNPVGSTPQEMAEFLAADAARLGPLALSTGVRLD